MILTHSHHFFFLPLLSSSFLPFLFPSPPSSHPSSHPSFLPYPPHPTPISFLPLPLFIFFIIQCVPPPLYISHSSVFFFLVTSTTPADYFIPLPRFARVTHTAPSPCTDGIYWSALSSFITPTRLLLCTYFYPLVGIE